MLHNHDTTTAMIKTYIVIGYGNGREEIKAIFGTSIEAAAYKRQIVIAWERKNRELSRSAREPYPRSAREPYPQLRIDLHWHAVTIDAATQARAST